MFSHSYEGSQMNMQAHSRGSSLTETKEGRLWRHIKMNSVERGVCRSIIMTGRTRTAGKSGEASRPKEHILRTRLLPYFENKKMCDIRAKDIIQWQNEQISYRDEKGKPYAPTYLKTLQSELSTLFNHAVQFYELKSNPVVTYRRLEEKDVVTDPKTPKSKRNVSMSDFLCEELKKYIGKLYGFLPNDRIFHLTKDFL